MVKTTQPHKEIRHHEPDNWNRVRKDTPRGRILSQSIKQLWLQFIKNIFKKQDGKYLQGKMLKKLKDWQELTRWKGFSGGSEGKASACNAGDLGSIPESGRSSGEGNGNTLQYSHLENSIELTRWKGQERKERGKSQWAPCFIPP